MAFAMYVRLRCDGVNVPLVDVNLDQDTLRRESAALRQRLERLEHV